MRDRASIAELRDRARHGLTELPTAHRFRPTDTELEMLLEREDNATLSEADADRWVEQEWLRLYALRESRQFARPFPARAFLAFCVAGCFAWIGIVAALRWWMQ